MDSNKSSRVLEVGSLIKKLLFWSGSEIDGSSRIPDESTIQKGFFWHVS